MRVLVTRPEPGASRTAEKLRLMGHEPVVLPLSRIVKVTPNPVPSTLGFLACIMTSANAVSKMPVRIHRRLSELPCYVVGEVTANAARDAGFDVRFCTSNSSELAAVLLGEFQEGDSLAYACGRVRTPWLEQVLADAGIRVTSIEVYDTIQVSYTTDFIISAIADSGIDAILAYSVVAARQINEFRGRLGISNWLKNSDIYCLSDRIAAEFSAKKGASIKVAAAPEEDKIFELLVSK